MSDSPQAETRTVFEELPAAVAVVSLAMAGIFAIAPLEDRWALAGATLAISLTAAGVAVAGLLAGRRAPKHLPSTPGDGTH